jgi:hypothetical protein
MKLPVAFDAMKNPNIKEITRLLISLKPSIDDDFRAYDDGDPDDLPSILVTVGADGKGGWSYQTGDTQYTGGAYGFPHWGQCALERRSNCRVLARGIIEEIKDAIAS